jgi:large subunit ribosomal protein L18
MKVQSLQKKTKKQRQRTTRRVRAPILAGKNRPRLSVYRSLNHIYAQIIDDTSRKTLVSFSDLKMTEKKSKIDSAKEVGKKIAELALKKKISTVVFDRSWYRFHGRVKALAESSRIAGLKF